MAAFLVGSIAVSSFVTGVTVMIIYLSMTGDPKKELLNRLFAAGVAMTMMLTLVPIFYFLLRKWFRMCKDCKPAPRADEEARTTTELQESSRQSTLDLSPDAAGPSMRPTSISGSSFTRMPRMARFDKTTGRMLVGTMESTAPRGVTRPDSLPTVIEATVEHQQRGDFARTHLPQNTSQQSLNGFTGSVPSINISSSAGLSSVTSSSGQLVPPMTKPSSGVAMAASAQMGLKPRPRPRSAGPVESETPELSQGTSLKNYPKKPKVMPRRAAYSSEPSMNAMVNLFQLAGMDTPRAGPDSQLAAKNESPNYALMLARRVFETVASSLNEIELHQQRQQPQQPQQYQPQAALRSKTSSSSTSQVDKTSLSSWMPSSASSPSTEERSFPGGGRLGTVEVVEEVSEAATEQFLSSGEDDSRVDPANELAVCPYVGPSPSEEREGKSDVSVEECERRVAYVVQELSASYPGLVGEILDGHEYGRHKSWQMPRRSRPAPEPQTVRAASKLGPRSGSTSSVLSFATRSFKVRQGLQPHLAMHEFIAQPEPAAGAAEGVKVEAVPPESWKPGMPLVLTLKKGWSRAGKRFSYHRLTPRGSRRKLPKLSPGSSPSRSPMVSEAGSKQGSENENESAGSSKKAPRTPGHDSAH